LATRTQTKPLIAGRILTVLNVGRVLSDRAGRALTVGRVLLDPAIRVMIVAAILLLPALALAHHALQSEFEINKPSRHWTGTLKSVQWMNPHSHFVIDVADETGKVTTWRFETAAPNGLRRLGFSSKGFFEVGKTYAVIGYPARDGSAIRAPYASADRHDHVLACSC